MKKINLFSAIGIFIAPGILSGCSEAKKNKEEVAPNIIWDMATWAVTETVISLHRILINLQRLEPDSLRHMQVRQ